MKKILQCFIFTSMAVLGYAQPTANIFNDTTDNNQNSIMFLNAGKFDFNESSLKNYVFHFNVFAPSVSPNKWGINLGILKINYTIDKDSLNGNKFNKIENILINPFDTFSVGNKYLKQYNTYVVSLENTSVSYYVQPTFKIVNTRKLGILLNAHFELLANTYKVTSEIKNVKQDTLLMQSKNEVYQANNNFKTDLNSNATIVTKYSNLSFMAGFGATIYARPLKGTCIFVQPTFGWSFDYTQPLTSNTLTAKSTTFSYLTRVYLQQDITDKLKGIIGLDSRGSFNVNSITNSYAAYIGVNLQLGGLKALFN